MENALVSEHERRLNDHERRLSELDDLDNRVESMERSIEGLRADIANGREETRSGQKSINDALAAMQKSAWESIPKWAADAANEQAERLRNANRTMGMMIGVIASFIVAIAMLIVTIAVHML
jgi:septation ring formation regulator EzrA